MVANRCFKTLKNENLNWEPLLIADISVLNHSSVPVSLWSINTAEWWARIRLQPELPKLTRETSTKCTLLLSKSPITDWTGTVLNQYILILPYFQPYEMSLLGLGWTLRYSKCFYWKIKKLKNYLTRYYRSYLCFWEHFSHLNYNIYVLNI